MMLAVASVLESWNVISVAFLLYVAGQVTIAIINAVKGTPQSTAQWQQIIAQAQQLNNLTTRVDTHDQFRKFATPRLLPSPPAAAPPSDPSSKPPAIN
jgi:urease accessory protein UreF